MPYSHARATRLDAARGVMPSRSATKGTVTTGCSASSWGSCQIAEPARSTMDARQPSITSSMASAARRPMTKASSSAPITLSTIGSESPCWYARIAVMYASTSCSRPAETGSVLHLRTSSWLRMRWRRTRPVRPLPSMNGWMVSNCAWTIAAFAIAFTSSRWAKATRSSRQASMRLGTGGTNSAPCGLYGVPPTQTCSFLISPPNDSPVGPISASCTAQIRRLDTSGGRESAKRMAATFPWTMRALAGASSVSSARATLRTLDVRRSICELAADSLRSRSAGRS